MLEKKEKKIVKKIEQNYSNNVYDASSNDTYAIEIWSLAKEEVIEEMRKTRKKNVIRQR